jgi:NTP pyrophosphatase (non-canonical NTP hydrolase)
MNIKDLQERSYKSAIKRGKITEKTTIEETVCHLTVELGELANAKENGDAEAFSDRLMLLLNSTNITIVGDVEKRSEELYVKTYKKILSGTKADELADIILIALTTAKAHNIDIERALMNKQRFNELRDNIK